MSQALLEVRSHTHYGRGTPILGADARARVEYARELLDDLAPGLPAYGYSDEDYGWVVPLTAGQVTAILERYPTSNTAWAEREALEQVPNSYEDGDQPRDAIVLCSGKNELASIYRQPPDYMLKSLQKPPVDRAKLFEDWFDNYGCY